MKIKCDYCGKVFNKDLNQIKITKNHFCSRKCFGKFKSEHKELWPKGSMKLNDFEIKDDIVEIYVESKTHGFKTIIIDREDYEKINFVKWSVIRDHNTFYAIAKNPTTHRTMRMHRIILGVNGCMSVDHINHNGLDNRKQNLKECTHYENTQNVLIRKDNSTGFKGVSFSKKSNKYVARITKNKKRLWVGQFNTIEEAVSALERIKNE